jgi:hypothetical protein
MIPVILICAVLTLLGLIAIIRDLYEKMYCLPVEGEVTGSKEVYDTDPPHDVNAYVPIITFVVNGVTYSGKSRRSRLWREPNLKKRVTVLYNPKNPTYFSIPATSRAGGYVLFAIGAIGLFCAWLTLQSGAYALE